MGLPFSKIVYEANSVKSTIRIAAGDSRASNSIGICCSDEANNSITICKPSTDDSVCSKKECECKKENLIRICNSSDSECKPCCCQNIKLEPVNPPCENLIRICSEKSSCCNDLVCPFKNRSSCPDIQKPKAKRASSAPPPNDSRTTCVDYNKICQEMFVRSKQQNSSPVPRTCCCQKVNSCTCCTKGNSKSNSVSTNSRDRRYSSEASLCFSNISSQDSKSLLANKKNVNFSRETSCIDITKKPKAKEALKANKVAEGKSKVTGSSQCICCPINSCCKLPTNIKGGCDRCEKCGKIITQCAFQKAFNSPICCCECAEVCNSKVISENKDSCSENSNATHRDCTSSINICADVCGDQGVEMHLCSDTMPHSSNLLEIYIPCNMNCHCYSSNESNLCPQTDTDESRLSRVLAEICISCNATCEGSGTSYSTSRSNIRITNKCKTSHCSLCCQNNAKSQLPTYRSSFSDAIIPREYCNRAKEGFADKSRNMQSSCVKAQDNCAAVSQQRPCCLCNSREQVNQKPCELRPKTKQSFCDKREIQVCVTYSVQSLPGATKASSTILLRRGVGESVSAQGISQCCCCTDARTQTSKNFTPDHDMRNSHPSSGTEVHVTSSVVSCASGIKADSKISLQKGAERASYSDRGKHGISNSEKERRSCECSPTNCPYRDRKEGSSKKLNERSAKRETQVCVTSSVQSFPDAIEASSSISLHHGKARSSARKSTRKSFEEESSSSPNRSRRKSCEGKQSVSPERSDYKKSYEQDSRKSRRSSLGRSNDFCDQYGASSTGRSKHETRSRTGRGTEVQVTSSIVSLSNGTKADSKISPRQEKKRFSSSDRDKKKMHKEARGQSSHSTRRNSEKERRASEGSRTDSPDRDRKALSKRSNGTSVKRGTQVNVKSSVQSLPDAIEASSSIILHHGKTRSSAQKSTRKSFEKDPPLSPNRSRRKSYEESKSVDRVKKSPDRSFTLSNRNPGKKELAIQKKTSFGDVTDVHVTSSVQSDNDVIEAHSDIQLRQTKANNLPQYSNNKKRPSLKQQDSGVYMNRTPHRSSEQDDRKVRAGSPVRSNRHESSSDRPSSSETEGDVYVASSVRSVPGGVKVTSEIYMRKRDDGSCSRSSSDECSDSQSESKPLCEFDEQECLKFLSKRADMLAARSDGSSSDDPCRPCIFDECACLAYFARKADSLARQMREQDIKRARTDKCGQGRQNTRKSTDVRTQTSCMKVTHVEVSTSVQSMPGGVKASSKILLKTEEKISCTDDAPLEEQTAGTDDAPFDLDDNGSRDSGSGSGSGSTIGSHNDKDHSKKQGGKVVIIQPLVMCCPQPQPQWCPCPTFNPCTQCVCPYACSCSLPCCNYVDSPPCCSFTFDPCCQPLCPIQNSAMWCSPQCCPVPTPCANCFCIDPYQRGETKKSKKSKKSKKHRESN